MKKYKILTISGLMVLLFTLAIVTFNSKPVSSASAFLCHDDLVLCVEIDEILPPIYKDALQNYPALMILQEDINDRTTYLEFNVSLLPQGITVANVSVYVEDLGDNLKRNKQQTSRIPLIYTASEPAPICMRDTNGEMNGLYSVNNQLEIVIGDPRCWGDCSPPSVCDPTANEFGSQGMEEKT